MKNSIICSTALSLLLCLGACTPDSSGSSTAAPPSGSPAAKNEPEKRDWQAGTHYELVAKPERAEEAGAGIEVAEIFWYGCTHCYTFEPHLVLWSNQAKDVHIVRVPTLIAEPQRVHARLFYTLQYLDREDLHQSVYDAIHRAGNPLTAATPEQALELLLTFARMHGIAAEDFKRAYESETVAKQVARAEQLMRTYKVQGTPSIVVNGKYLSDLFLAGGQERLISLTQHLTELRQ